MIACRGGAATIALMGLPKHTCPRGFNILVELCNLGTSTPTKGKMLSNSSATVMPQKGVTRKRKGELRHTIFYIRQAKHECG